MARAAKTKSITKTGAGKVELPPLRRTKVMMGAMVIKENVHLQVGRRRAATALKIEDAQALVTECLGEECAVTRHTDYFTAAGHDAH